jgi:biotin synthase-like enzyme
MTNKKIIEAFSIVKNAGIEVRSYNIIGLPFETKENIMETVNLNRVCEVDSVSLSIFIPYEGTVLRDVCIEHNLLDSKDEITGDGTTPVIYNPNLSNEELLELYNNFSNLVLGG